MRAPRTRGPAPSRHAATAASSAPTLTQEEREARKQERERRRKAFMVEREREFLARQREILGACGTFLQERESVWGRLQDAERGVAAGIASLKACLEEGDGLRGVQDSALIAASAPDPAFERKLVDSLRAVVMPYVSRVDRCSRAMAHAQAELSALDSAQQALRGRLRTEIQQRLATVREREEEQVRIARDAAAERLLRETAADGRDGQAGRGDDRAKSRALRRTSRSTRAGPEDAELAASERPTSFTKNSPPGSAEDAQLPHPAKARAQAGPLGHTGRTSRASRAVAPTTRPSPPDVRQEAGE